MPSNDLWWLDGDDPLDPDMDLDLDDELGNIFGDIVGAVGKIAAAPVNLVASALPKPIRKPFQAISAFASPTALLDKGTRRTATGVLGGALGGRASAGGRVSAGDILRGKVSARGRAAFAKPKVSLSGMAQSGANDALLKRMVEILGAKDIAKIAAGAKPRLSARSTGSGTKGSADKALATAVASAVIRQMNPTLKTINSKLSLAENQRLATSEHNALNNVTAFRRKVLQDLMRISSCLPESHPTRQRIRRVGLMSGLL